MLTYERVGGSGLGGYARAMCHRCGWKGALRSNASDYQTAQMMQDFRQHKCIDKSVSARYSTDKGNPLSES